jgi:hypothetical protein
MAERFLSISSVVLLGCLLFVQCENRKPEAEREEETMPGRISVADFSADSAFHFIEQQVNFGPRIPQTGAHAACLNWMSKKFNSFADSVIVQNATVTRYDGKKIPCHNVIASFQPEKKIRLLLMAHWDTRPWSDRDADKPQAAFPGADDGASGVAVLMEVARQLTVTRPAVGVDIVLFDMEDQGPPAFEKQWNERDMYCLGSQYWSKNPHTPMYRAYYGVLLDMVGARNALFPLEGFSQQFAPLIHKKVWDAAAGLGFSSFFVYRNFQPVVDDHFYVNTLNGTPSIDIIHLTAESSSGFAAHWHTQNDNLEIIDKATIKAVGQTLLQVIYSEQSGL